MVGSTAILEETPFEGFGRESANAKLHFDRHSDIAVGDEAVEFVLAIETELNTSEDRPFEFHPMMQESRSRKTGSREQSGK